MKHSNHSYVVNLPTSKKLSLIKYSHITLQKLPYSLILLLLLLVGYGLLVLYSISGQNTHPWVYKQILHLIILLPLLALVVLLPNKIFFDTAYLIYACNIVLLLLTTFYGVKSLGAIRWLEIGNFRFQPAEITKISVILTLARYLHQYPITNLKNLLIALILSTIPAALIIKQPDLGSGIIVLMIAGGMLVIAGMSIKILSLFCLAVIIATPIIFNGLHDYQKQRIENFLNPEKNHLSSGYNIFQSKIAIGSGGLSGKGIGQGTQTNLKFLPEKHTDFIFAGLAEDLGFIGSVIFLILVYLIIWTNYFVGRNSKIVFHKMLVHGVNMLFFSHICLNIGMVSGMLPVVGIPLPLISYGGTIFWITLLSFGLTVNVHVNRNVKI